MSRESILHYQQFYDPLQKSLTAWGLWKEYALMLLKPFIGCKNSIPSYVSIPVFQIV